MNTNGTNGQNGNGLQTYTIQDYPIPQPIANELSRKDRLRPHSIEMEQALLGALLIDPDAMTKIAAFIEAKHFFSEKHGFIYQAIYDLYTEGRPADFMLISDELDIRGQLREIGGAAYLTTLIQTTPTSLYAEQYAKEVYKKFIFRQLIEAAGKIAKLAYEDGDLRGVMDQAEELIFKTTSLLNSRQGPEHIRAGLDRYYERLEYLAENQGKITGLPTGLLDLDNLLGGLQRSDMIALAGRPGMGKTSLALSIARIAARRHAKRVAIFSLEMSEEQLIQRLVSIESGIIQPERFPGIDSQRLRLGNIKQEEWPIFYQAVKNLSEAAIFIDDTPAITINYLRSQARRLAMEHGLDLLIVDYLQLMSGSRRNENRQQEVSDISRGIKSLARELNIPVLALSQLSRKCEERADKRPLLSDLRESGSIEQDSDVVLFIYRDEVYNPDSEFPNIAEIICAKHRSGPTGSFSVYFKKHLATFDNLVVKTMALGYEPMPEKGGGLKAIETGLEEWLMDN